MTGNVLSILMWSKPWSIGRHRWSPSMSMWCLSCRLSVVVVQPVDESMPDSGSLTLQLIFTLLRYQPLLPKVPLSAFPKF